MKGKKVEGLTYDPTCMEDLKALIQSRAGGEKLEPITLQRFVVGKDKVFDIPFILREISQNPVNRVLVVSDETPIKRGEKILRDLVLQILHKEGLQTDLLVLKSDETGLLHASMEAVLRVKARIGPGDGMIAIGGGTVTDICKYAAFLWEREERPSNRIPLIILQTATSGSAFGSNQSVIFKEGVKRTLRSVYPTAVLADTEVITSGPLKLNLSGFGDMSGILISSADWYVSHSLGTAEGYSEFLVDIMRESGQALLRASREIGALSPEGIEVLGKILVLMGIVSSMGFGTTPISGFEHMISHALDMEGMATGRKLSLHGAQAGLGAAYASVAYDFFIKEFSPNKVDISECYPSDEKSLGGMKTRFGHLDGDGRLIEELWTHYHEKLVLWRSKKNLFERFLTDWEKPGGYREKLSKRLPDPRQVIAALSLSGNPVLPEDLLPPVSWEQMKFAFLNARFMRNRFIVADLLGLAGMLNDRFWERVDSEVRRIRLEKHTKDGKERGLRTRR